MIQGYLLTPYCEPRCEKMVIGVYAQSKYSKTCLKRPLNENTKYSFSRPIIA